MNKKSFFTLLLCLWASLTLWAVDASYYTSYINNKSGSELFTGVHNVAKVGYSSLSYNGLWSAYCAIDINSAKGSNIVWDMYSNTTSYTCGGTAQGANYSKEGDSYNREHSIPKSWFGGSESNNTPGTDLFHVVPTDGYVNNMRSSFAFGEVASATYTSNSGCKKGTPSSITIENSILNTTGSSTQSVKSASTVFEPMNEYKGDFARGYFGTMLRWANGDYQTFSTAPGDEIFNTAYTAEKYYGLTAYGVALLLKWHREDPVSQKEIDRNNGIQNQQGNRNPFIDYPVLAEYIWGKYTGETFSLDNAIGSFSGDFIPGESDGDANGGGSSSTKYTITWSKDGNTDTTTEVKENARPTPPEAADCDANRVFMGWTASSTYSGDGSDLMTVQSNFPQATEPTTYYAVYADKETSGSGSATITFTPGTDTGTTSVEKDGVTCTMSTMNNSSYYQIYASASGTFTASSGNITEITFTCTASGTSKYGPGNASANVGTYSYDGNTGTWTGSATSVTISATVQVRMSTLSITVDGGGSTTYSNYSTECTTCEKVTITFNANGGEGSMTAQQVCPSTSVNLSSNTYTREHYTFIGWNTKANGTGSSYADKASVNIDANLTLYAQWTEDDTFTATFYANGSKFAEKSGYAGDAIPDLSDPTPCEGYTFVGWLTTTLDETTTNPSAAAVTTIPAANTDYYAVYKRTESSGGGSGAETTLTMEDYKAASGEMGDFTFTAGGSGTSAAYNTTGKDARYYAGNTLTISGSEMTQIVFNLSTQGKSRLAEITADVGTIATQSVGDETVSWTGSADEVTFTVGSKATYSNSDTTKAGQLCFTSVSITSAGASTTTYYSTSCSAACNATITVQSLDDAQGTVSFE